MTVLASFPRWYGGKFFSSLCSYYMILCIRLWNKIVSSICVFVSIFTDLPSFFIFKRLHLRSREYKQNIRRKRGKILDVSYNFHSTRCEGRRGERRSKEKRRISIKKEEEKGCTEK